VPGGPWPASGSAAVSCVFSGTTDGHFVWLGKWDGERLKAVVPGRFELTERIGIHRKRLWTVHSVDVYEMLHYADRLFHVVGRLTEVDVIGSRQHVTCE